MTVSLLSMGVKLNEMHWISGVMGVPITFMDKYNPEQFEIIAFRKGEDGRDLVFTRERERVQPYFRILVQRQFRG